MKAALIVLLVVLLFLGIGFFAYRSWGSRIPTAVTTQELQGHWVGQGYDLRLQAEGDQLLVGGLDSSAPTRFRKSGGSVWSESNPAGRIPRVLEWRNELRLRVTSDGGAVSQTTLQRSAP